MAPSLKVEVCTLASYLSEMKEEKLSSCLMPDHQAAAASVASNNSALMSELKEKCMTASRDSQLEATTAHDDEDDHCSLFSMPSLASCATGHSSSVFTSPIAAERKQHTRSRIQGFQTFLQTLDLMVDAEVTSDNAVRTVEGSLEIIPVRTLSEQVCFDWTEEPSESQNSFGGDNVMEGSGDMFMLRSINAGVVRRQQQAPAATSRRATRNNNRDSASLMEFDGIAKPRTPSPQRRSRTLLGNNKQFNACSPVSESKQSEPHRRRLPQRTHSWDDESFGAAKTKPPRRPRRFAGGGPSTAENTTSQSDSQLVKSPRRRLPQRSNSWDGEIDFGNMIRQSPPRRPKRNWSKDSVAEQLDAASKLAAPSNTSPKTVAAVLTKGMASPPRAPRRRTSLDNSNRATLRSS